jgi:hypothetical protein
MRERKTAEDDMAALAFVRALVQTDLYQRVEALLQGHSHPTQEPTNG